jgi:hypothetical protein
MKLSLLFTIVAVDAFSPTRNDGQFRRPYFFASKDGDDTKPFFLEPQPPTVSETKEGLKEAKEEEIIPYGPIISDETKEEVMKAASTVSNVLMEQVVVSHQTRKNSPKISQIYMNLTVLSLL